MKWTQKVNCLPATFIWKRYFVTNRLNVGSSSILLDLYIFLHSSTKLAVMWFEVNEKLNYTKQNLHTDICMHRIISTTRKTEIKTRKRTKNQKKTTKTKMQLWKQQNSTYFHTLNYAAFYCLLCSLFERIKIIRKWSDNKDTTHACHALHHNSKLTTYRHIYRDKNARQLICTNFQFFY